MDILIFVQRGADWRGVIPQNIRVVWNTLSHPLLHNNDAVKKYEWSEPQNVSFILSLWVMNADSLGPDSYCFM